MRRGVSWAVAAVVIVVLGVAALRNLEAGPVLAALRSVHLGWTAAAVCCYLAILPLWAAQWHMLARRALANTYGRMLGVIALMSSALNTTPFLVGEATGIVLLVTRIGLTRVEAFSITVMDQLLVGIAKLVVLGIAAVAIGLPPWMLEGGAMLAAAVTALLLACALVAWHRTRLTAVASRRVSGRAAHAMERIVAALDGLRSPHRAGTAFALALAKKLVEVFAILCMQRAFGVNLPAASAILVLAALNLATLLPIVPGNVGVYEGAVVLVYTRLGLTTEHALSIALVQHAAYFVALAMPGYVWAAFAAASEARAATA